ncbi:MAG: glycosyltransferase [Candidatus Lustribacter sp.]|jgi:cellulose synthase (UDP-forming)
MPASNHNAERADEPAPAPLVALRYALLLLTCGAALIYFSWRVGVVNSAYPVYSWIVYAAELIGCARVVMFVLPAVRLNHRVCPPAPPGLSVDVFIPTYDEPVDVVRRAILAALAIRYPHETWLLDDGERPQMEELARETGCRYLARTDHSEAKGGNLNHALSVTSGEFVALFDADHVASPLFLDRTLGYFRDPRLAFVQTPQDFFNFDSFEHFRPQRTVSNGTSFFHRIVLRTRDGSNSTMYTGSSAVFRRQALDAVSGFTTAKLTEDITTSLRLHAAGWRSAFHPEILSAGLAAHTAAAYYGQHVRWSQDALHLLLHERVFTRRGLTLGQRLAYLFHVAGNVEWWRHVFVYALPIIILVSGILPVRSDALTFLTYFVPYFLLTTLTLAEVSRGHGRLDESNVYNLARCPASLVATFTAYREPRFRVTPKTRTPDVWLGAPFTYAFLVVNLAAIAFACSEAVAGRSPFPPATLAVLLVWAGYHVVTAVRLLMLVRRCSRDRRTLTRFDESVPATIARGDDPRVRFNVDIVAASADGLTLQPRGGEAVPPAGDYRGVLDLAGLHLPFELSLRKAGLGGPVRWPDAAARASFDLLIHQRAIERLGAADPGDRGGLFRSAAVSRRRYPKPYPDRASQTP